MLSFNKSFDLPVSIIRPFNTYGPRQSARAIIPTIISQVLRKKIIEVGSLSPRRDLLYIEDTVRGIISAIGNKKSIGEVINLGSGYDISIKNLIEKIGKILNKKIKYRIKKNRIRPKKSEVMRLLASNKKAKKLLNWKPIYSNNQGLSMGLKKLLNGLTLKRTYAIIRLKTLITNYEKNNTCWCWRACQILFRYNQIYKKI